MNYNKEVGQLFAWYFSCIVHQSSQSVGVSPDLLTRGDLSLSAWHQAVPVAKHSLLPPQHRLLPPCQRPPVALQPPQDTIISCHSGVRITHISVQLLLLCRVLVIVDCNTPVVRKTELQDYIADPYQFPPILLIRSPVVSDDNNVWSDGYIYKSIYFIIIILKNLKFRASISSFRFGMFALRSFTEESVTK